MCGSQAPRSARSVHSSRRSSRPIIILDFISLQTEEKRTVLVPINYTDNVSLATRNANVLDGLGTVELTLNYGVAGSEPSLNPVYSPGPVDQAPVMRAAVQEVLTERAA